MVRVAPTPHPARDAIQPNIALIQPTIRMTNTDKIKAARSGGGLRYRQKLNAMHDAAYVAHNNAQRVHGVQQALRHFEDAGRGPGFQGAISFGARISTGAQYEHEQRMAEQKAKRDEKKKKAAAWRAKLEAQLQDGGGNEEEGGSADIGASADSCLIKAADTSSTAPLMAAASPPLRFGVGSRVRCQVGLQVWATGQVVQLNCRERSWPPGKLAPYQIALDNGEVTFAPVDSDAVVCAEPKETGEVEPAPVLNGDVEGHDCLLGGKKAVTAMYYY